MEPEDSSHVNESPPLGPILSQVHPVHTSWPYFPEINFNIILPSTLGLPSGLSFLFRLSD